MTARDHDLEAILVNGNEYYSGDEIYKRLLEAGYVITKKPSATAVPPSADNSMLDRVADALACVNSERCTRFRENGKPRVPPQPPCEDCILAAKRAIAAMREPTQGMKECSEEVHWGYNCHTCGGLCEGWYAMIDAALSGK
jgi:hypothetical protein